MLTELSILWWSFVWPCFWQAAVLLVIVAAVDRVIRRWARPQMRMALWSLVMLKLVLPPTMFSPVSLTAGLFEGGVVPRPLLWVGGAVSDATAGTIDLRASLEAAVILADGGDAAAAPAAAIVVRELFLIWIFGVAALGLWHAVRLARIGRAVRTLKRDAGPDAVPAWLAEVVAEQAAAAGLRRAPEIVLSDRIAHPGVVGTFRPTVLVPVRYLDRFDREDLRHVVVHELMHVKRGDVAFRLAVMVIQTLNWFNPIAYLAQRRMTALQELCCDAAAISHLVRAGADEEHRRGYRRTLLRAAALVAGHDPRPCVEFGLLGPRNQIIDRLRWLETYHGRPDGHRYGPSTLVVMLGIKVFVFPMAPMW